MNKPRKLQQNVWYKVGSEVNIGEPLFKLPTAVVLLHRVLREIRKRYPFEMRGLRLDGEGGEWLTFYIKPDDGLKLPVIMHLLKQTFSARFNARTGRTGHVWGERHESEILEGGPPEGLEEADWEAAATLAKKPVPEVITYTFSWGSSRTNGQAKGNRLSFEVTPKPASPPA